MDFSYINVINLQFAPLTTMMLWNALFWVSKKTPNGIEGMFVRRRDWHPTENLGPLNPQPRWR